MFSIKEMYVREVMNKGSGWFDEYTDIDNFYCTQRLIFHSDGRGEEIITRYFRFPDDYEELESTFWWEWDDDYRTIYMEYSNGDYIYFDDLHIYYDELSGYLGDDYVTFEPF
mgnify:FL=1